MPAGFGMKLLKFPVFSFTLFLLNIVGFFFFAPLLETFNASHPNAWQAFASLFYQTKLLDFLVFNSLLLFLSSFLEQKVSGHFLLALYVAGGLSGLVCILPLMKGTNEVLLGSSSSVFAIGGGVFFAFRKFRFQVNSWNISKIKLSQRLNRIVGVWVLPGILIGAEAGRYISSQTLVYSLAHISAFAIGVLLVWKYSEKQEANWPWISDDEMDLYYQSKSQGFEKRFQSLRSLALSNLSNPRTWSEWVRVSLKYPNETALVEISKHLISQILEHSKIEAGKKQWFDMFNQKYPDKGIDLLISKLEATDVLRLADWAIENRSVKLAFKILLSPAVRMDLHWIVNYWLRKVKQGQFSKELTESCYHELKSLAETRELPQALQKFQNLLDPESPQTVKKVA